MARSQRGVICTTPEAVKSLMLMNVDILSSLENYEREVVSSMLVSVDQGMKKKKKKKKWRKKKWRKKKSFSHLLFSLDDNFGKFAIGGGDAIEGVREEDLRLEYKNDYF